MQCMPVGTKNNSYLPTAIFASRYLFTSFTLLCLRRYWLRVISFAILMVICLRRIVLLLLTVNCQLLTAY